MKRGATLLFLPVLALCILWVGLVPANAAAKRKPAVYFAPAPAVNEGAPIPFSWDSKRLGRGYRLVIQRPFGTVHVWKSIMRLPAASGTGELAGYPLGVRRLRIAAFRGRRLLAKQVAWIYIYGAVPFTTLFDNENPSVFTAPDNSFSYVTSEFTYTTDTVFGVANNNCSSVHVAFVPGTTGGLIGNYGEEGIGTVTIVQESRDPETGSAAFDTVGSVDAELTPGQTWGVNVAVVKGEQAEFYINGYAICYSTEPFHG